LADRVDPGRVVRLRLPRPSFRPALAARQRSLLRLTRKAGGDRSPPARLTRPRSYRHRHYRLSLSSADARRTSERNSDLYPNGSDPRAAVAISMILSKPKDAVWS